MLIHRKHTWSCDWFEYSPGLINKVHSLYISFPWFRFTHMDLALRVLFHRFQIIFGRIRLNFSVAIGTIVCITKPRRSCSWIYKISKHLVSPNECLNNLILERTIEYNIYYSASNSTAKESNATSEIEAHKKKDQCKVHLAYSSAHMFVTSYHMSQLRISLLAVTIVNTYAVTCPCKN